MGGLPQQMLFRLIHTLSQDVSLLLLSTFCAFAFSPASYVAWCLFFLGLPPPPTLCNHEVQAGFDYPVQRCLGKQPFSRLRRLSCCRSGCRSTIGAHSKKHTYLSRVVVQAALEAGLAVRVEPDTHNLLLGEFSKADCRRIFPKAASKQYQEKFQAVLNALEVISSPACTISAEEKTAYVQARIDALPVLKKHELKGLRIDAAIENPITGETKWIDVSVTHTSAASYIDVELKAVGEKMTASNIAATFELPDYLRNKPSPSLLKREAEKNSNTPGLSLLHRNRQKKRSASNAQHLPLLLSLILAICLPTQLSFKNG